MAAATAGAITARADRDQVAALAAYAKNLGLAFQIVDDLLDVEGDPAVTGKPRLADAKRTTFVSFSRRGRGPPAGPRAVPHGHSGARTVRQPGRTASRARGLRGRMANVGERSRRRHPCLTLRIRLTSCARGCATSGTSRPASIGSCSLPSGRAGASRPWRSASSLRIGLLAALLLGPSTAVGLGARVPGLVVGPRDGLVLAVYLGAVFLVAVALTAFAVIAGAGLLVGRSGRASAVAARAAILARGAGLVVGAGTLAYLMFWWRGTGSERAAWHQPLWTAVALAGAAGFSVLVGHSVTTAAQAVIAVAAGSADPLLGRRRRSLATTAIVWALACAGAAGLLQIAGRGPGLDPLPDVPHLERRTTGVSILVLGMDGFDPVFGERLVAAGKLPAIGTLLAGGRADLARDGDADPAAVWTSIATGQPVDVHGVRGIEARRVSGLGGEVPAGGGSLAVALAGATDLLRLTRPAASSGRQRRAKTFWEVAGEQGLRVGVVNWWATWPAPEQRGRS